MDIKSEALSAHIAAELARITNRQVVDFIKKLLLPLPEPYPRDWNYGELGQQFVCWTVLRHPASKTEICFCPQGFGPTMPWGLVGQIGEPETSMGMDSGWFFTFLDAFFDSIAVTELPIWCVFKGIPDEDTYAPVTGQGGWKGCWEKVLALREENPGCYYTVDTTVRYPRS